MYNNIVLQSSSSGKSRKKLTGKISPLKARKLQDTPQKERMKKLADNLIKHRRSKTASLSLVGAGSSQAKEGKPSPVGKVGRRKSIGGLKLSSALFSSKKTDDSANESVPAPDKQTKKVLSIPSLSGVVVQPKVCCFTFLRWFVILLNFCLGPRASTDDLFFQLIQIVLCKYFSFLFFCFESCSTVLRGKKFV